MITLAVSVGKVYVWNATDWLTLREKHRIIGELVGCLPFLPRQESLPGLPLALLPEEVTLLVERQVARLVQYPGLLNVLNDDVQETFKQYRDKLRKDQVTLYTEERKRHVMENIDSIIEGKRRKLLGLKTSKRMRVVAADPDKEDIVTEDIDKDQILQNELSKINVLDENQMTVQIFTAHPWHLTSDEAAVVWDFPGNNQQKLRYQVFKNLWEKGYYITAGHKFGVDYLVYPGDPIKFHAHFLVICIDNHVPIPILDVVALGRLGTSVRKTIVLASWSRCDDNTVTFQSLSWNGTSRS